MKNKKAQAFKINFYPLVGSVILDEGVAEMSGHLVALMVTSIQHGPGGLTIFVEDPRKKDEGKSG